MIALHEFNPLLLESYSGTSIHTESMSEFYRTGLAQEIEYMFVVTVSRERKSDVSALDRQITRVEATVKFRDVKVGMPKDSKGNIVMPTTCLLNGQSYEGTLSMGAEVHVIAYKSDKTKIEKTIPISDITIPGIPIMVGSNLCHTRKLDSRQLVELGENPSDPGGYFVINGQAIIVPLMESSRFNSPRIYDNRKDDHDKQIARCEILSKQGEQFENSGEVVIIIRRTGTISIRLTNQRMYKEKDVLELPFYMLFRALGMTSTRDMMEAIMLGFDDIEFSHVLETAYSAEYSDSFKGMLREFDQSTNLMRIGMNIREFERHVKNGAVTGKTEEEREAQESKIVRGVSELLDKLFLPHMGQKPEERIRKLRYFAWLINQTILVALRRLAPTNRDSYLARIIHDPGRSVGGQAKTEFGRTAAASVRQALENIIQSNVAFEHLQFGQAVRTALTNSKFGSSLMTAVQQGEKQNKPGASGRSRVASQPLVNKSALFEISQLRQIKQTSSEPNKSAESSKERRDVRTDTYGFVCPTKTPDTGEDVGKRKDMCISVRVTLIVISRTLRRILEADPLVTILDKTPSTSIQQFKRAPVFVNGYWVGVCDAPAQLVEKYRQMRLRGEISRTASIFWEKITNSVYFWVDSGRLVRPLMRVRSNLGDVRTALRKGKKPPKFTQELIMTRADLKKPLEKMLEEGVIEYISPEEQSTCLVAISPMHLEEDRHNLNHAYTHCDIPAAMFGLSSLTAVIGHTNQPARISVQTNHAPAQCEWNRVNWRFRTDKGWVIKYFCSNPIIGNMVENMLPASATNAVMALYMGNGYNQEDSFEMNAMAIKRGMFKSTAFNKASSEIMTGQVFRVPSVGSSGIRSDANYSKLQGYVVPVGCIVEAGDVLIAKLEYNKETKKYEDKSSVYTGMNPAIVEKVYEGTARTGQSMVSVHYRIELAVDVGDKFSTRQGQKGVCAKLMDNAEMLFDEHGMIPSVCMNPHSLPTRLTKALILEILCSNVCVRGGFTVECNTFDRYDLEEVRKCLRQIGMNPSGTRRMFSGHTGEPLEVEIFMGHITMQRLNKLVGEAMYAVGSGPTSSTTRQPPGGRSNHGSMRLGEMEVDNLGASGAIECLREKLHDHSDKFKSYYCARCGNIDTAIANEAQNEYYCTQCRDKSDICSFDVGWMNNVVLKELAAMNVSVRLHAEPLGEE